MHQYFLRIGSLGEIQMASSGMPLQRGQRVIARSSRGIEVGEVVSRASSTRPAENPIRVLRPTTSEDELLIGRLRRHKRRAIEECQAALVTAGCDAVLLDIDQTFDGGSLMMHFLGDVNQQAHRITQSIAARYESVIQSRHFAKLLADGCGPDCGTAEGSGCGGGCSSCSVACGTKR